MRGWSSIGVVAAIVPWNFPLMLLSWKVRTTSIHCDTSLFVNMSCQVYLLNQKSDLYHVTHLALL